MYILEKDQILQKIKDQYFTNSYVRLQLINFERGDTPKDKRLLNEFHDQYSFYGDDKKDERILLGGNTETGEVWYLTILDSDPELGYKTQIFNSDNLVSLLHEMGHFVSAAIEDCVKPKFNIPSIDQNSSVETICANINYELSALHYQLLLSKLYLAYTQDQLDSDLKEGISDLSNNIKQLANKSISIDDLTITYNNFHSSTNLHDFNELWLKYNNHYLAHPIPIS